MSKGVKLRVWGDYACFTRPEMKVERVSYDVMTPSAARGILEAIYWKPQFRWVIRRIRVLSPIRFTNIRRNEIGEKGPSSKTVKRFADGHGDGALAQYIEDMRQQRASMILRDVDYVVEAGFEILDSAEPIQKHLAMFHRRVEKGQHFHQPYLGCREFAADVDRTNWTDHVSPEELQSRQDMGWMLLDVDYDDGNRPLFFRAVLDEGVLAVPSQNAPEVRR